MNGLVWCSGRQGIFARPFSALFVQRLAEASIGTTVPWDSGGEYRCNSVPAPHVGWHAVLVIHEKYFAGDLATRSEKRIGCVVSSLEQAQRLCAQDALRCS